MVTYPLNNIEYTAEDAELFHATRTSGIFATDSFGYSVTGADNTVVIGTGIGWIKNSEFSGKVFAQKTSIALDLGIPDSNYPRIDAIAIRFDANANSTEIVVKKGTATSNPVAPNVLRTESVYELHLYQVRRDAGEIAISPANITDLRLDSNYCGLMADPVTSIDTDAINKQVSALITSLQDEISNVKDGSAYLLRDGTTPMTGALSMSGYRVTNLGTPVNNGDAVPKKYIDGLAAGDIGAAPSVHAAQHSASGSDPITPADIGALSVEQGETLNKSLTDHIAVHNVKTYTALAQIGLSDDDMDTEDALRNLEAIYQAMPSASELRGVMYSTIHPNLWASILTKLQTDISFAYTGALNFRFIRSSYMLEVVLVPQSSTYVGMQYRCVLRYNSIGSTLTTFVRSEATGGFVRITGDTMTGNMSIAKGAPAILLRDSDANSEAYLGNANNTVFLHNRNVVESGTNRRQISLYNSNAEADVSNAAALIDVVDGTTTVYKLLHTGNLAANGVVRIETGSYVGTGTYGEDNPNSLTFGFEPKMVLFTTSGGLTPGDGYWDDGGIWTEGASRMLVGSWKNAFFTCDGNTLSWYTDTENAACQFNASGTTYYYLAIG